MEETYDEAMELFREIASVQRMADQLRVADAHGGATVAQEREYALQRAVVAQRYKQHVEAQGPDEGVLAEALADAEQTAVRLRDLDAEHGTGHGPVPPGDARWQGVDGAAGYVQQEVTADQQTRVPR